MNELTHDRLTRDVWLWQRKKGHRFSSDDTMTAYVAAMTQPHATRYLDLGCGIGSVLLQVAWALPRTHAWGIEAQQVSFDLLQRNVAECGFAERVGVHHGDLRDAGGAWPTDGFDLITGTPPYFPPGTAVDAHDAQRAFARLEYRGGVEAYLAAAAPRLTDAGAFVMCGDSRAHDRVTQFAPSVGLAVRAVTNVFAMAGRPSPLFSVWTMQRHATGDAGGNPVFTQCALRNADHTPSVTARMLKAFVGLD